MAYPTLADLKAWMGVPDASQDTPLGAAVAASIALFERACNRTFIAASAARPFQCRDPWVKRNYQQLSFFAECTSITSVVNGDGTTITAGQYWLLPEVAPYDTINLLPSVGLVFTDVGQTSARIIVTALWGFAADVPPDVRYGMLELARALYEGSKQGQGGQVVTFGSSTTVVPGGLPEMVHEIQRQYERRGL